MHICDLEATVVPIRSPSVDAAVLFDDGSLDAVFIDGSHIYLDVVADIDAYLPKICKNGLMFGHDLRDVPSRFDRNELLSVSSKNNCEVNYTNSNGEVERVDVHPGVILAVQDKFGDDVERFPGSVFGQGRLILSQTLVELASISLFRISSLNSWTIWMTLSVGVLLASLGIILSAVPNIAVRRASSP